MTEDNKNDRLPQVPEDAKTMFKAFWTLIGYLTMFIITLIVISFVVYILAR